MWLEDIDAFINEYRVYYEDYMSELEGKEKPRKLVRKNTNATKSVSMQRGEASTSRG